MKCGIALILGVLSLACSFAQDAPTAAGLNIPNAHPRLFWTPERLAQARTWHRSNPFVPTTGTGAPNYIYDQVLKYVLTGDAAQCKTAIDWASALTIPPSGLSAVANNAARWYGEQLVLTYDWCYDQWTPQQRSDVIDRWNGYFTVLMAKPWGGLTMPTSNFFWGYLRNELEWGIATKGDNPDWKKFVDFALDSRWSEAFVAYAARSGRGGVPEEGTEYGPYMVGYMGIPIDTLATFGRNILAETNWYREFVYAMIYLTTPGPTARPQDAQRYYQIAPWSDCCDTGSLYPEAANFMWDEAMRTMAGQFALTNTGKFARQWVNVVNNNSLYYKHIRAADAGGPATPFNSLPLDYYAPGSAFLSTRSSWNTNGTWVIGQLGDTFTDGGHGHHDAGSFQLWHDGQWLSKETTGYGNQIRSFSGKATTVQSSEAHNTLLFNGVGLANAYPDKTPSTLRLQSGKDYSYIASDLSGMYRAHASGHTDRDDNPYAKTVIREFLFVKPLDTLVVFDRLESQSDVLKGDSGHSPADSGDAVVKTFILHSEELPTVSGSTITAASGKSVLRATTLVPISPSIRVVDEGNIPTPDKGFRYQYRTEIEDFGAAQSYFLNVLQARSAAGSDVISSVVDEGASYRLTLTLAGVGTAVIQFNKGMTSNGGAFGYATTGTPTLEPLPDGVQVMQVTDNGPVWSQPALRPVRQPGKDR